MTIAARRSLNALALTIVALTVAALLSESVRSFAAFVWVKFRGGYTVSERLGLHGQVVESRLRDQFAAVGLTYPPAELAYVSFKDTRKLEVYGRPSPEHPWRFVKEYPVLGLSGGLGPKLADGDNQVPEGVYRAEFLNPNSRFHLSIRLNYPNDFDRRMAQADGRNRLGGDIMIHGSSASIGCLAMGDQAAEDLFILAALVTKERLLIVISPTDFRAPSAFLSAAEPVWVNGLYGSLRTELQQFRKGI